MRSIARKVGGVALAVTLAYGFSALHMQSRIVPEGRPTQILRIAESMIAVFGTWLAVRRRPRPRAGDVARGVRIAAWTMRAIGAVAALQLVAAVDMGFVAGRASLFVFGVVRWRPDELKEWAEAITRTLTTPELFVPFLVVAAPVAAGVTARRVLEGDDARALRMLAAVAAVSCLGAAFVLRPGSDASVHTVAMLNPVSFALWSAAARPWVFGVECASAVASVVVYVVLARFGREGGPPLSRADAVEDVYSSADVE